jgi:hypothetical protein
MIESIFGSVNGTIALFLVKIRMKRRASDVERSPTNYMKILMSYWG